MNLKRPIIGLLLGAVCCMTALAAQPVCDPDNGGIKLPEGFCAVVVADGLGTARHAVAAPNGDLYIPLQSGKGKSGGLVALRDTKGDDGSLYITDSQQGKICRVFYRGNK